MKFLLSTLAICTIFISILFADESQKDSETILKKKKLQMKKRCLKCLVI